MGSPVLDSRTKRLSCDLLLPPEKGRSHSFHQEDTPRKKRPKPKRMMTIEIEQHGHMFEIYLHSFNSEDRPVEIEIHKRNTTEEVLTMVITALNWAGSGNDYELCEIMGTLDGQTCKERRLDLSEYPVAVQLLWPTIQLGTTSSAERINLTEYRFVVRKKMTGKNGTSSGRTQANSSIDTFLAKFLQQPKDKEYPDLCMLPELTEQTLLENVKDRFNNGHIYTYIGPILVAVNPFSFFPIYNPKYVQLYQNRRLGSLPPHIFAMADSAYHVMMKQKQNQCIVISGESGSGKTESTNFLLHHLTALSQKGGQTASGIEQNLLCAGPVLEAFGNAVTAQNNNSSRFGKFVQVNYRENGMVYGANVQIYLLEKSRIISQAEDERNYHVFYYLLSGATKEERQDLELMPAEEYHYLNQNQLYLVNGMDDGYEFKRLRQSMELVGFSPQTQVKVWSVLSAVLQLGNIKYMKKSGYHSDETAFISNPEVVDTVARLLQVKEDKLTSALTTRRTVTRNETVVTRYKVSEAIWSRNAMAKCLYNSLFDWIVLKINQSLLKKEVQTQNKGYYIGILDIFGFEDVGAQWNSFEQFCINYANERLQSYFNQHIFQFEQEEYRTQGIKWQEIHFLDNTECLHLLQKKPTGLFHLVDEECSVPKATDETLLDKFNKYHKVNEFYEIPNRKEMAFIIAHYAGKVKYQITGFREKNSDLMRNDIVQALKHSKSAFVKAIVGHDPVSIFRWGVVRAAFRATFAFRSGLNQPRSPHLAVPRAIQRHSSDSKLGALLRGDYDVEAFPSYCDMSVMSTIRRHVKRRAPLLSPGDGESSNTRRSIRGLKMLKELTNKGKVSQGRRINQSVGAQFQGSLNRLMETLSHANPFFIRCIRSNNEKISMHFDQDIILRQLRYTGMLETVRIRRAGYSVRLEYKEFAHQYRVLLPKGSLSEKEDLNDFIQDRTLLDMKNVQFGLSKVFMRDAEKLLLDDQLHRYIVARILRLQSWFRTYLLRRRFLQSRESAIKIQAWVRGTIARRKLYRQQEAAAIIQNAMKAFVIRKHYIDLKSVIVPFDAHCRGYLARLKFREMKKKPKKANNRPFSPAKPLRFKDPTASHDGRKLLSISPREDNDEGVVTKGSSQDEEGMSSPREIIRFTCDSEESSGILDDSDGECQPIGLAERSMSLDAEFVLISGQKLKLVSEVEELEIQNRPRRQSIASVNSASRTSLPKQHGSKINKAASSDQICEATEYRPEVSFSTTLCLTPSQSPSNSQAGRQTGIRRAKKHFKNLLKKMHSTDIRSDESEDEATSSKVSPDPIDTFDMESSSLFDPTTWYRFDFTHSLKAPFFHRSETCAMCNKSITLFFRNGLQCQGCRICFHKGCSPYASKFPCLPMHNINRVQRASNVRRIRSSVVSQSHIPGESIWLVNRTQAFDDPTNLIVTSSDELRFFNGYLFKKINELNKNHKIKNKRDTLVDVIFRHALNEFHSEMVGFQAALITDDQCTLKYKDLINTFDGILRKGCVWEGTEQDSSSFPVTLGTNAFRGFLNEFMNMKKKSGPVRNKVMSFRRKRKKSDIFMVFNGHRLKSDIVHVPTYCECCDEFMWHAEKIVICQGCRISCHKKCYLKLTNQCHSASSSGMSVGAGQLYGADLTSIVNDDCPVPTPIEKMMLAVELRGLFTDGLYRKAASIAQCKQARRMVEESRDYDLLSFDDLPVHILASLIKTFFRELPEPLMTYEFYENFLNVVDITVEKEQLRCVMGMVELLPKSHRSVLERLLYHLARIARHSEVNRMTCQNLAVIFAPSLLKRHHDVKAQDQIDDANRQIHVIRMLIEEKVRQFESTMSEIVQLETAVETVSDNLKMIDEHSEQSVDYAHEEIESARKLFLEQLDYLDKEKDKLIEELPPMLAPMASTEDDTLTNSGDERDSLYSSRSRYQSEEYAMDWDIPPYFTGLYHYTKNRVKCKKRRKPSRQFLNHMKSS